MALGTLNGWQRLWLLLTVIYLIPVAIFTIATFPKEADIHSSWAYDAVDVIRILEKKDANRRHTSELRTDLFGAISDQDVVKRISASAQKSQIADYKQGIAALEHKYQKRLDELPLDRLRAVGIGLLAWVIPAISLYLLGRAVGWVYDGFRKRRDPA